MDLTERIANRRTRRTENRLVVDWDALNPAVHPPEPVGREALFEALLDAFDPVFENALPPNAYVWGPPGSGKSAIVTSLVSALERELTSQKPRYTATRGESGHSATEFVYVDARRASSRFRIYRRLLDELQTESVPKRGVSTDDLRGDLESLLATSRGVLVAVDHLGEPDAVALDELHGHLEPFDDVAWVGVGRDSPENLPLPVPETHVHVPEYSHELVDVLIVRGTRGLSRGPDHVHARRIADWADGNAHDALAGLFAAALHAEADGNVRLRDEDVGAGIDAVPRNGVPIPRVFGLSDNERRVLRALLGLPLEEGLSVDTAAHRVAERTELTDTTVKRLLYELAQRDVLQRREVSSGRAVVGRQPSVVEPNFSATLFSHIYDG